MNRPTGTVTFVFTDIEGSTRLWQDHPQAMKTAVADHDRIIRTIVDEHGGYIFSTGGDGFSIAFTHPLEAALAALDTQTALTDHDWGEVGDLRVRIALDTGLADERDGDYFGPALSRVARILDQTTGGEILTSNTTADLLTHQLPLGHHLERVGRRHLKDVDGVTTLHRLVATPRASVSTRKPSLLAIGLATVSLILGAVALGFVTGHDDEETADEGTTTTTMTTSSTAADDGDGQEQTSLMWSAPLGESQVAALVVGGLVVAPTRDEIAAFQVSDGTELWRRPSPTRLKALASDGAFVYLIHPAGIDVVHPVDGTDVPRCGFSPPTGGFFEVQVDPDAVFVLSGPLYRIDTQPGEPRCHGPVRENPYTLKAILQLSGPLSSDNFVVAGDHVGVYAFDRQTLEVLWQYPDAVSETIGIEPTSLAIREFETVRRGSVQTTLIVSGADAESLLHVLIFSDGQLESVDVGLFRVDSSRPAAVFEHTVVALTPDGRLAGIDLSNGQIRWGSAQDAPVKLGPIPWGEYVVAAIESELRVVDPIDGSIVWQYGLDDTPVALAVGSHMAAITDASGRLSILRLSDEPVPDMASVRQPAALPPAETVISDFLNAWSTGDRSTAEQLLGVDASWFLGSQLAGDMWPALKTEQIWAWFEHDSILDSKWGLESCAPPTQDRLGERITCSTSYTDALLQAAGAPPTEFDTAFVVRNGVIRQVADATTQGADRLSDFGGRWQWYVLMEDWLAATYPEEWSESCVRAAWGVNDPACAHLRFDHLTEWSTSLG